MKFLNLKLGPFFVMVLSVITLFSVTSCDKDDDDDDFVPQPTNYITFSPLMMEVEVSETSPIGELTLTADIKEFAGLEITNIDLYFIKNSNEYTSRETESASFSRETSATYFNSKLNIAYLGERTSTDFVMPFDQYEATINVPLDRFPPVIDEYFYVGIEFTYADGSKYRGTCRVDYIEEEEE